MVGTTDEKAEITFHSEPTQPEIDFIIKELHTIFGEDFDYQGNMLSAWSGIRPLVKTVEGDEEKERETEKKPRTMFTGFNEFMKDKIRWFAFKIHGQSNDQTASLARNHVIEESESGLISLMGGKWTSFRKMGEETVDKIIERNKKQFEPKYEESQTLKF